MEIKFKEIIFISILTLLTTFLSAQQKSLVYGIVYDGGNFSPIPYVNIVSLNSGTGTISQNDGSFTFTIPKLPDTLKISALGYLLQKIPVTKPLSKRLEIELKPISVELNEVVVRPGENPALRIMRNVIREKHHNNPMNAQTLVCNAYTKILVNSLNEKENIFSNQKGLPIFFTEKISQNYIQQNPFYEKGKILFENQKGLGLFNELSIIGYSNNLSLEFNFYDNSVKMFDKPFISPLSDMAFSFYNFHLRDSSMSKFGKEYLMEFTPKNSHDLVFKGNMKIIAEEWFISEITTRVAVDANLNYVNKLDIYQTFIPINDSLTFFHINQTKAELKITKDNSLLNIDFNAMVNKKTIYSDVLLNIPAIEPGKEDEIFSTINPLKKQTINQEPLASLRPEELSISEKSAISTIDSLNDNWKIKSVDAITRMFLTGYIPGKLFDIGPYLNLIKYNKVEGYRFTLSGRTSTNLTKNTMLFGHLGYGTLDDEWKYGAGLKHKIKSDLRNVFTLEYINDLSKLGDNRSIFLIKQNMMVSGEDNLIASIFTNKPLKQLSREISYRTEFEHEWKQGISSTLNFNHKTIHSGIYLPFIKNNDSISRINTDEITLGLRLSWKQKITDDYCRRYYLNTDYPVISLRVTGGQFKVQDVSNPYLTMRAVIDHKFVFGTSSFYYILESGMTFGNVPFPLLEFHRSDQSVGYANYAFNMMNEMEFASDRFISLMAQYHLNGLIFNRIPLLKKLGVREVFTAKLLWGHLSDNHQQILDFPGKVYDAQEPYAEVSVGIENIFQYYRLDFIWRITQTDNPGISQFAIKGRFDVKF